MTTPTFTSLFKAMRLHQQPHANDFNCRRPFDETARVQLECESDLFGCAFNPYAGPEDNQLVAIAGADGLHVYNIPLNINRIEHVSGCTFEKFTNTEDKKEELYTVAWAYDTFEANNHRNPYKLVTGGAGSKVYVIDFGSNEIDNHLLSFGGEINEIRTSPSNSNIVATACSDHSVRIHHIRNQSPLITCGGYGNHLDAVLSVDWHFEGNYIVSCGKDHRILKWDLSVDPAKSWMEKTCAELAKGERNVFFQGANVEDTPIVNGLNSPNLNPEENVGQQVVTAQQTPKNNHLEILTPVAICDDLHSDFIDCIRMLPGSDMFASKGSGNDPTIKISVFGLPKRLEVRKGDVLEPEKATTTSRWMTNPSGEAWFTKFVMDPRRRWTACAGCTGEVFFFDGNEEDEIKQHEVESEIRIKFSNIVRHVDYSPCGRLLVGCTDNGLIFRIDRISADVEMEKLKAFRFAWDNPNFPENRVNLRS